MYPHDVDLPVRTLRRLCTKMVSVQWMSGRTFPALEDCAIIWPHHPETLRLRGASAFLCARSSYILGEPIPVFRLLPSESRQDGRME